MAVHGGFRALIRGLMLAAGSAAGVGSAEATVLSWSNAAGGFVNVAANWSPNQVPLASDDLVFNLPGSYLVRFEATVATTRTWTFRTGTPTMSVLGAHTVTSSITIGDLAGDNATATLFNSGTITTNAVCILGDAIGATGTLNASDAQVDLLLQTSAADLLVGNNGNGHLNITAGGRVAVDDRMLVGGGVASVSSVLVSGIAGTHRSALEILAALSPSAIGSGGDATLTVTDGGLASFSGGLNVAQGVNSQSSATIGGGVSDSELVVGGDLNVAGNLAAGTPGGVGTLTINENGDVRVGGTTNVATDPDGGNGTLIVNFGGSLSTHNLVVSDSNGVLQHTGGLITIEGGTFDPRGNALVVNGSSTPQVRFRSGATATLTPSLPDDRALVVGALAGGQLTGTGNATSVHVTSGRIVVGDQAGSNGLISFSAGADIVAASGTTLVVGNAGDGVVQLASSQSSFGAIQIAAQPGSDSELEIRSGSVVAASGPVSVGGNPVVAQGVGLLTLSDAGTQFSIAEPGVAVRIHGPSSAVIETGATLTAVGRIDVQGGLTLSDGTINAQRVNFQPATLPAFPVTYSMAGTVNAQFDVLNSGATITLTGDLAAGTATLANGFGNFDGTMNVGDHRLTMRSTSSVTIGNATLGALGVLTCSNPGNGGVLNAGKTLTGDGTVDMRVINQGSIVSTGDGLTFNGLVEGVGQGISGVTTHWLGGGSFTGSGAINTPVHADSAAVFIATGPLFVGGSAGPDTIQFGGTVMTGAFDVNFYDSNGITLGVNTELDQGIFRVINDAGTAQPTLLPAGSRLGGRGTFISSLLTAGGTIDVGDAGTNRVGALNTRGIQMQASAVTNIEVGGSSLGEFDRIVASGPVVFNGTLNVTLTPGFNETAPFSISVVSAAARVGTFATVNLPARFSVRHHAFGVSLDYCPADFDSSGQVTIQDIFDFLNAWFAGSVNADVNFSGGLEIQDIFDFLNAWFAGC